MAVLCFMSLLAALLTSAFTVMFSPGLKLVFCKVAVPVMGPLSQQRQHRVLELDAVRGSCDEFEILIKIAAVRRVNITIGIMHYSGGFFCNRHYT